MVRLAPSLLLAMLLGLLAGCGGLPRPFQNNPGGDAGRLVQPPAPRIVVVRPTGALLSDAAAGSFVGAMATALADRSVPAVTRAKPGDWTLVLSAEVQGDQVLPLYKIFDNTGEQVGIQQGQPLPADQWARLAPAPPLATVPDYTQPQPPPVAAPSPGEAAGITDVRALSVSVAQNISDLLTRIDAQRRASDPNSLLNRQARMRVPDVVGAPGDGNRQLARQMRADLAELGLVVQDGPGDFTVSGEVKAVPIAGGQTRIEIQWVVADARGDERGHILQLNEVPAGSLDRYWGDVAAVVAQEAATGVRDIVVQQIGTKPGGAKPGDAKQTDLKPIGAK